MAAEHQRAEAREGPKPASAPLPALPALHADRQPPALHADCQPPALYADRQPPGLDAREARRYAGTSNPHRWRPSMSTPSRLPLSLAALLTLPWPASAHPGVPDDPSSQLLHAEIGRAHV